MFERFTEQSRRVVVLAREEAARFNHVYIGTEHIMLGLVCAGEGVAARALASAGVGIDAIRGQVVALVGVGKQPPPEYIPFSLRARAVLELAFRVSLELGHDYVAPEHLLLGLIREGDGVAIQALIRLGADPVSVRQQVLNLISGQQGSEPAIAPRLPGRRISPAAGGPPVKVFISYAHEDEELRQRLERHLALLRRQGAIDVWTDRRIMAGEHWADEIDRRIESAELVLLLVSADFMASDYCYGKEMTRALERHGEGGAVVVPVMLKPVDWEGAPFRHLATLPTDARPLTSWPTLDDGLTNVARGIRAAVARIRPR